MIYKSIDFSWVFFFCAADCLPSPTKCLGKTTPCSQLAADAVDVFDPFLILWIIVCVRYGRQNHAACGNLVWAFTIPQGLYMNIFQILLATRDRRKIAKNCGHRLRYLDTLNGHYDLNM